MKGLGHLGNEGKNCGIRKRDWKMRVLLNMWGGISASSIQALSENVRGNTS